MLGRQPQVEESKVSPKERERLLDTTYQHLKSYLIGLQDTARAQFMGELNKVSRQYGVDPNILMFYLVDGKNWPRLPRRAKDALRLMQSILLQRGFPSFNPRDVEMFDDLQEVHNALVDLAMFTHARILPSLEDAFYREMRSQAQHMVNVLKEPGDKVSPKPMIHLMDAFEQRLQRDRFPGKSVVLSLLSGFK